MQFLIKLNSPIRQLVQPRSPLVNCFCMCDQPCVVLISHTLLWAVTYLTLEIKFLLEPNMPYDSTMELNIPTVTLFLHWLFLIQQEHSHSSRYWNSLQSQLLKTLKWKNTRYWHSNKRGICCKCCFTPVVSGMTSEKEREQDRGRGSANRLCTTSWFQQHCPAKSLGNRLTLPQ